MNLKNYTLSPDVVEIYPSIFSRYAFYGIILCGAFTILSMGLFPFFVGGTANLNMASIITDLILFALFTILALVVFMHMKARVVIDRQQRTVYRKTPFTNTRLGNLNDVAGVMKVNITTAGSLSNYYYSLKFKDDVYGKGVALTNRHVKPNHKRVKAFEADVLPILDEYFKQAPAPQQQEESTFDYFEATTPQFYKQTGDIFYFFDISIWGMVVGAILLGVGITNIVSQFKSEHPFHEDGSATMFFLLLQA